MSALIRQLTAPLQKCGTSYRKLLPIGRQVLNQMASSKHTLAARFLGTEENVWTEFNALAAKHNACNMGQGFPNFCAPIAVRQALANATLSDNPLLNQYTRGFGHPALVKNLARLYSKEFNRQIDPMTEVLVTGGAYEALFCSFQGLVNPGDEVIIIEPFFDTYKPMAITTGAKAVYVPIRPPALTGKDSGTERTSAEWKLDPNELERAFSPRTKFLIINSPNNPLGKTYTQAELEMVANFCIKNDIFCISDEVYEWLAMPPNKHIRMANLPGMWDRTVTIGSAGKTFSVTGWKLGWAVGPKYLISSLQVAHQNCVNSSPTPIQEAVATGFDTEIARMGQPDCYFTSLAGELKPKRDMMADVLRSTGFIPIVPEGGYFMLADYSKHADKLPPPVTEAEKKAARDFRFVKWMIENYKLATIPVTCFYSDEHRHIAENYIRICYIKKDETLMQAKEILQSINRK